MVGSLLWSIGQWYTGQLEQGTNSILNPFLPATAIARHIQSPRTLLLKRPSNEVLGM